VEGFRTKAEIAHSELDRLLASGVRFGVVLADAAYGMVPAFRHGLSDRALLWTVGIACTQSAYAPSVGPT